MHSAAIMRGGAFLKTSSRLCAIIADISRHKYGGRQATKCFTSVFTPMQRSDVAVYAGMVECLEQYKSCAQWGILCGHVLRLYGLPEGKTFSCF